LAIVTCLFMTELTERPFELLGSQSERDRDVPVDLQDTAESQDTADSQSKSGLVTYLLCGLTAAIITSEESWWLYRQEYGGVLIGL